MNTSLFSAHNEQIDLLQRLNCKYQLGFSEFVFEQLETPVNTPSKSLVADVLVPYFETVTGTFEVLWELAVKAHPAAWRWKEYSSEFFRLWGEEHPLRKLRWERIDFGAHVYRAVRDVRKEVDLLPHAGVIAALFQHPNWARWVGSKDSTIPHIGGYEVDGSGLGFWGDGLSIGFYAEKQEIQCGLTWVGASLPPGYLKCSVPVFVK